MLTRSGLAIVVAVTLLATPRDVTSMLMRTDSAPAQDRDERPVLLGQAEIGRIALAAFAIRWDCASVPRIVDAAISYFRDTDPVVVAANDIGRIWPIKRDMIRVVRMPKGLIADGAFKDAKLLIGRSLWIPAARGEALTIRRVILIPPW